VVGRVRRGRLPGWFACLALFFFEIAALPLEAGTRVGLKGLFLALLSASASPRDRDVTRQAADGRTRAATRAVKTICLSFFLSRIRVNVCIIVLG